MAKVEEAGLRVEAVGSDGRVAGTATTATNGSYRISNLPPGEYAIVISGSDVGVRRLDATVSAGQTARVDAQLAFGNVRLDPLVVSASKRPEKATEAPARITCSSSLTPSSRWPASSSARPR